MKKILITLLLITNIVVLSACETTETEQEIPPKQEEITCEDGYIKEDNQCVLIVDEIKTCEDGFILQDDECVEEKRHKMFEIKGDQRVYIDVPYKRVDGVTQYLDIYFPEDINEDMPVFMYVHGGGFLWGNKDLIDETHRINHVSYKDRLNELGYIFISVGYQKTKNNTYPCLEGQISDVKDAIKWVKLNHLDLHSSDENIGLWGLSAGGALALAAALNPDENYQSYYPDLSSNVRYVIDFYGITDIYDFYNFDNYPNLSESDRNTEYWRVNTHTNLSSESTDNYQQIKDYVDLHSPLYNLTQTDVKIAIHHGDSDHVVTHEGNAQPFYDLGVSLGNDITLTTYPNKDHGFWWDTALFYYNLREKVISEVLLFSE